MLIKVAIPIPYNDTFIYSVPTQFRDGIDLGKRVFVPFRRRKAIGYIVGKAKKRSDLEIRDIIDIIDEKPLFDKKRLRFYKWISEYYIASLGIVLKFAHPLGLGKSLVKIVKLTQVGETTINSDGLTPLENQILNVLRIQKELTVEKLINIIGELKFEDLNSLFRKKYIELDYAVISDEKIKYEKIYSTRVEYGEIDKIKKRKRSKGAILEFIANHQQVSHSDLKNLFGNLTQHIKWLTENSFVSYELKEISRDPFKNLDIRVEDEKVLTDDQESVCKLIKESINSGRFETFLLHGVTGSGKTEVYIQSVREVIKKNRQALVLVPEISLTPLLVSRFRSRFGDDVAVIHSQLSEGDRFDAWRRANRGEVKVIIGARSAIFAPLKKLGIVIVDEEHENTYKEGRNPFYNGRNLAVVLGNIYKCPVILGSATPSLESFYNVKSGKYRYLLLPNRIRNTVLPQVELVDMRNIKEKIFSPLLKNSLIQNFEDGNQSLLFLNRRGFSNLLICAKCGELFHCPNCSITLTYHKVGDSIKCHYCGINEHFENECVKCGGEFIKLGLGTQLIEEEVTKILPNAKVEIMDADSVRGKTRLLSLYKRLEDKKVDVLIGTQMIAKGHDLPGITLVGVISADQSLGIPDFRSGERTFQLVTQVAGRAGRGKRSGKVIVQTYNPKHPSIKFALAHDSEGFLNAEMRLREAISFPPFTKIANIRVSGSKEYEGRNFIKKLRKVADALIYKVPKTVKMSLVGPSESPLYRLKNKFRWQMIIVSDNANNLNIFCTKLLELINKEKGSISLNLDIDPYNFM